MLYAKIVFGLPIEGPFDYIIPKEFYRKIKIGSRVWVPFRTQRKVGYIVRFSKKTNIKNIKAILGIIDEVPILDKNMLSLTKELSNYYCCAWGEAIETALPEVLRRGKTIPHIPIFKYEPRKDKPEPILLHYLDRQKKWDIYIERIKDVLSNQKSVIILFTDVNSVLRANEIIKDRLGFSSGILYRKQPNEIGQWFKIKRGEVNIIIGTRSSIFAPVNNLGLLIIDEEQNNVYKQEQVPHYNARVVAFMRANIEKVKLILSSMHPSLESFYLSKINKVKYLLISPKSLPEIKIINMSIFHKRIIISKYLEDAIISNLNSQGKILLFLNRKGFATVASCRQCGFILKCAHCNINLVYYFKDNILCCHYCNFRLEPPKLCPSCNSDYIRYFGAGAEKIESELSRLFPQARIKRLDNIKHFDINDADIFISTSSIIKQIDYPEYSDIERDSSGSRSHTSQSSNIRDNFGLIGILSIDNSLNRIDFRAAEKTFNLLIGLRELTNKQLVIQTKLPEHYCFKALVNNDAEMFYEEELRQRKQLEFPPFRHLALIKLRGKKEEKVKKVSTALFNKLKRVKKDKKIYIIGVHQGWPSKLRGNYYWNILIKSKDANVVSKFLKKQLKDFSHYSGIIVTVDVDPL